MENFRTIATRLTHGIETSGSISFRLVAECDYVPLQVAAFTSDFCKHLLWDGEKRRPISMRVDQMNLNNRLRTELSLTIVSRLTGVVIGFIQFKPYKTGTEVTLMMLPMASTVGPSMGLRVMRYVTKQLASTKLYVRSMVENKRAHKLLAASKFKLITGLHGVIEDESGNMRRYIEFVK